MEVNFDNDEFRTVACIMTSISMMGKLSYALHLLVDRSRSFDESPYNVYPGYAQKGLRRTLSNYDSIRDVGIVTGSETGAFLGSNHAVLDCLPGPSQPDPFLDLTHLIPWVDPETTSNEENSVFVHVY